MISVIIREVTQYSTNYLFEEELELVDHSQLLELFSWFLVESLLFLAVCL